MADLIPIPPNTEGFLEALCWAQQKAKEDTARERVRVYQLLREDVSRQLEATKATRSEQEEQECAQGLKKLDRTIAQAIEVLQARAATTTLDIRANKLQKLVKAGGRLAAAYYNIRHTKKLPIMPDPKFYVDMLQPLAHQDSQLKFDTHRAARHMSTTSLTLSGVQIYTNQPARCFYFGSIHDQDIMTAETELGFWNSLPQQVKKEELPLLTKELARCTTRHRNGTIQGEDPKDNRYQSHLGVLTWKATLDGLRDRVNGSNAIDSSKVSGTANTTPMGTDHSQNPQNEVNSVSDQPRGIEELKSVSSSSQNANDQAADYLDSLPTANFPKIESDPFAPHTTSSEPMLMEPPSNEKMLSLGEQLKLGFEEALESLIVQKSIEQQSLSLLDQAQLAVGSGNKPPRPFGHSEEEGEETEALMRDENQNEEMADVSDDNAEIDDQTTKESSKPKDQTKIDPSLSDAELSESDDRSNFGKTTKKSTKHSAPSSGVEDQDSDESDDDDPTGGAGATRMGTNTRLTSKPKPAATKAVKGGRVSKSKPATKASKNPFSRIEMMAYAGPTPGGEDNFDAWYKKYRSADCSVYRRPEVGKWREKANALRVSGYTRVLARQNWDKDIVKDTATKEEKKAQGIKNAAELGSMDDWLAKLTGKWKWDEEKQTRLRNGESVDAEEMEVDDDDEVEEEVEEEDDGAANEDEEMRDG